MRVRLKLKVCVLKDPVSDRPGRAMPKKVVSIARGTWRTGELVSTNGIYAVQHREHRLPPEVTLVHGELFPRCEACDSSVTFRILRKLHEVGPLSRFRVQLFQLPVLDKQDRAS